jgi:hypothetical protein
MGSKEPERSLLIELADTIYSLFESGEIEPLLNEK